MADKLRSGLPYVWVTWITGLLSGDKQCRYATWLKAHYWHEKRPDPDAARLAIWKGDHADMVRRRVAALEADGWTVSVEGANKFTRKGAVALLAGGPDIIATRDTPPTGAEPVFEPARGISLAGVPVVEPEFVEAGGRYAYIEDCKTGRRRDSDVWQVLTYQLFAPKALADHEDGTPFLRDLAPTGGISYPDGIQPVAAALADKAAEARIGALIREIAADQPPPASPSAGECRYCDIASCRWRKSDEVEAVETEAF